MIGETKEVEETIVRALEASGQFTPDERAAIALAFAEAAEVLTQMVIDTITEALEEEDEEDDW